MSSTVKRALLGFVGERVFAAARVTAVGSPAPRYRLIALELDAGAPISWRPGDKVQLNVGDWNVRTYTPLYCDGALKRLQLLAYVHGGGPGSTWAASVQPGWTSHVLGPRSSLPLASVRGPAVLFGDETSFAVAANLQAHAADATRTRVVLEVEALDEARRVAGALELRNVTFVARRDDGAHHAQAARAVKTALDELGTTELLATGGAPSIQRLRAALKGDGVAHKSRVRAYWAPGKVGLD